MAKLMFKAMLAVCCYSAVAGLGFNRIDCHSNDTLRGVDSHSIFLTLTNDTTPCRALTDLDLPVNVHYDVSVEIQNINSTPGLFFNVKDDANYDIVLFRTGEANCVIRAAMVDGEYIIQEKHTCEGDPMDPMSWLDITMEVRETTFSLVIHNTVRDITLNSLTSTHPEHPTIGLMHGLGYKEECEFDCAFNFKALKLSPDTPPQHYGDKHGTLSTPENIKPNQLSVHRVEFHSQGRDPNKNCWVAFYFKEMNLGKAKIFIDNDHEFVAGDVKMYKTQSKEIDVYFHPEDMGPHPYTILYNTFACAIDREQDVSFVCDVEHHNNTYGTCVKSTGYMSDKGDYAHDANTLMGWYSLNSCAGNTIPTESPGKEDVCGAKHPVWLKTPDSGINSTGETMGSACVVTGDNNCAETWDMPVFGCDSGLLYYLVPTAETDAYCAGDLDFCDQTFDFSAHGPACENCRKGCRPPGTDSLSGGAIAGIVIGSLVAAGCLGAAVFFAWKRYQSDSSSGSNFQDMDKAVEYDNNKTSYDNPVNPDI